jgi:hypothetical protein
MATTLRSPILPERTGTPPISVFSSRNFFTNGRTSIGMAQMKAI